MSVVAGTPVIESPAACVRISLPSTVTRTITARRCACAILLRTTRITASALAGSAERVGDALCGAPQPATTNSATARRAAPRTIGMRSDVTEVDAGGFQNTFALDKEGERNQVGVRRHRITDGVDQPYGVAVERHRVHQHLRLG